MNVRMNSAIVATTVVAAIAVGIASASTKGEVEGAAAAKSDRLPIVANAATAALYVTVETRGDGVSMLERILLD